MGALRRVCVPRPWTSPTVFAFRIGFLTSLTARSTSSRFIGYVPIPAPYSRPICTFGILAALIGSLSGSVIQWKNLNPGNWFLIAVLPRLRSLIWLVNQLCQMRSVRASTGLKQRQSVFDQISFPLRTVSDHGAVVRPHFQNYSNRRIGRKVRSGFRSSLGGPALPHGPHAVLSSTNASPSTELALFTKPHSTSLPWKNPSPSCSLLSVVPPPPSHSSTLGATEDMAFRRVDPAPFLPHGFVAQQVDHREIMGIVLVHPLPEHEVNFHIFDDIIREYLVEVRRVQVRSIQRSHLGQALVRFRVLMWDPDPNNATRLLVRARVTSLQEVPQFIAFSVAEGFQGVSWTVQCDIVQQFMLGAQPQDEDPVPPYPHDGVNAEEDVAINADEGWDPWPVKQAQPPEPVVIANNANVAINEEEQFSYQLSGLEDLPSDDSGNNVEGQDDMQIEENINVGLMLHLDQTNPDPAFEDFMARKCSSSWADLFPGNDGSVFVPKLSLHLSHPAWTPFQSEFPPIVFLPPVRTPLLSHSPLPSQRQLSEKRQPISVDTTVRRSARLRAKAKGFKNCPRIGKKNCSCCTQYTPTLQLDVIKKLGAEFCKMIPSKLNPEDLSRSKATGIAIQRPVVPPSSKDDEPEPSDEQVGDPHFNDDNDDESSTSAGL
ncbi:hypothetical protein ZEAMMB73_Zm00001d053314 [Zea mays]|uniref:Uncharacterized protein n=1 Tax=Zea mays TaxID=4577 RepID=K7UQ31_MAIZE|nr:hypothetical protein ZEAMMB73_Zm00001d053314 [Zea mays]